MNDCQFKLSFDSPRRTWLAQAAGGLLACAAYSPLRSMAAASEAPLSDALRGVLGERWRAASPEVEWSAESQAWQSWARRRLSGWMPETELREELVRHAWYEARRAGLSLSLVLGLIEVESGFRKHALSAAGAMGYMQIMPFWVRAIGDGDVSGLWRTSINLRYGCVILRHYLHLEGGDLAFALGRYNGTRGQTEYPSRVLAAQRSWRSAHD
ncbi:MAG: hypothetical protein RIT26_1414 [Pseudomonadota bacterium]